MRWLLLLSMGWCEAVAFACQALAESTSSAPGSQGYCAQAICTRECSDTDTCPDNSTCSTQGKRSVCLPKCETDSDCLKGFGCSGNVCVVQAPLEPSPS